MLKNQKGITLVSLVITVIVLLILAGVAITIAVNSDGIFGKTNQAKNEWANAIKDETDMHTSINTMIQKAPNP